MAGCGYVCPQCEGKGWIDAGTVCNWCSPIATEESPKNLVTEISDDDWIEKVHGACACSDIGVK